MSSQIKLIEDIASSLALLGYKSFIDVPDKDKCRAIGEIILDTDPKDRWQYDFDVEAIVTSVGKALLTNFDETSIETLKQTIVTQFVKKSSYFDKIDNEMVQLQAEKFSGMTEEEEHNYFYHKMRASNAK